MSKIGTCLWFNGRAEEAALFYTKIFKKAKIVEIARCLEGGPGPVGSVMTVRFILDGSAFMALNGGPQFQFTPAVSFVVKCKTQKEIDRYWEKLSAGGQEVQCGWLTDKFGVSWQIVPIPFLKMMKSKDTAAVQRLFSAMMGMKKLDVAGLEKAFKGKG